MTLVNVIWRNMQVSRLNRALQIAAKVCDEKTFSNKKEKNSTRSKVWIKALAQSLRDDYSAPEYRVFSADYQENRKEFHVNELLFDISVARIGRIQSASGNKTLEFVSRLEWAIESEFQQSDSRASIIDFSKLIMSSANNKLFVLPNGKKIREWGMSNLGKAVPQNMGSYYLCFIPHPKNWDNELLEAELFYFDNGKWHKPR